MSNTSLTYIESISPNRNSPRNHAVDRITPHCFVGQVTAKRGLEVFKPSSKKASCNYVIGKDGDIGLCVPESDRSWCSSSASNDNRAITIEVASDTTEPYAVTYPAFQTLVSLCIDICRRYNKDTLLWIPDKDKALSYNPAANEMLLTVHRWFANKSCPGTYIYEKLPALAQAVTAALHNPLLYKVQIGAFREKSNAEQLLAQARVYFPDAYIKEERLL